MLYCVKEGSDPLPPPHTHTHSTGLYTWLDTPILQIQNSKLSEITRVDFFPIFLEHLCSIFKCFMDT